MIGFHAISNKWKLFEYEKESSESGVHSKETPVSCTLENASRPKEVMIKITLYMPSLPKEEEKEPVNQEGD